ncbi:MAG TPA: nucleotide exchange factor GrpE [Pirellulales bacterium]|jgi:molecular chaperone GrpE|nr:nucleotide exchange factor GrpE [Pirellulales bacterium]
MNDTTNNETDAASTAEDTINQEVLRLRSEVADAKDRALRAQAEAENMRKRLRREMDDERKYALVPLLGDLLPVIDNVQRAIQSADKHHAESPVVEGFKMVGQQLEAVLAKYNCTRIAALHKPFDPNLHQAIAQQPSSEYPANTVLVVAQDGYQVHDRVLRPAQVIVSTAAG